MLAHMAVQATITEHATHDNEQSLRGMAVDMVIMIFQFKQ